MKWMWWLKQLSIGFLGVSSLLWGQLIELQNCPTHSGYFINYTYLPMQNVLFNEWGTIPRALNVGRTPLPLFLAIDHFVGEPSNLSQPTRKIGGWVTTSVADCKNFVTLAPPRYRLDLQKGEEADLRSIIVALVGRELTSQKIWVNNSPIQDRPGVATWIGREVRIPNREPGKEYRSFVVWEDEERGLGALHLWFRAGEVATVNKNSLIWYFNPATHPTVPRPVEREESALTRPPFEGFLSQESVFALLP